MNSKVIDPYIALQNLENLYDAAKKFASSGFL